MRHTIRLADVMARSAVAVAAVVVAVVASATRTA
jgi:hypothetical protein